MKDLSKVKIFLLGLPGSGKSTLGKKMSSLLDLPFIDLDSEIETQTGKKIAVIFATEGENHFRDLESAEVKRWCSSPGGFVMATGGGTPCYFDNIDTINQAGVSIFLDVPPGEIAQRLEQTQQTERPLLAATGKAELKLQIEQMRSQRIQFYRKAFLTVAGDTLTAEQIIKRLNP